MITNTGIEYYRGIDGEYRSTLWNVYNLYVPRDSKGAKFLRIIQKHNKVAMYLEKHPLVAKEFDVIKNGTEQYFAILSRAEEDDGSLDSV